MKFKCKKCGHKISVTSGTVFQDSHIPLNKWFLAIWIVAEYGRKATADMLRRELELGSNRTALSILNKIKKARYTTKTEKLEHTVEINRETIKFHGQALPVLIAVEVIGNAIGQIRIQQVDCNNKAQIIEFIKENVVPYSLVKTDLTAEQKKKNVGIVTPLLMQEDIGSEYNRLVKDPLYEYRFTRKVLNSFTAWMNNKCQRDGFEYGCKKYCVKHNSNLVSMPFEELLGNLLKLKARKK